MINTRLIGVAKESKRFIALNVFFQWLSLLANICIMTGIAYVFNYAFTKNITTTQKYTLFAVFTILPILRFFLNRLSSKMSFESSKTIKNILREKIYSKLLRLGNSYKEKVNTSEIVQLTVEGVDQLEIYFGAYLPQFFYAILAPITLFAYLSFISLKSAVVLFICVPLIPVTIILIQKWAKRLLSKYWGQYTALGDIFLENLQGLTTTKIYQSDEFKQEEMSRQSENFRNITMKVLAMQLNSITVMDIVAYGGAGLGIILAITELLSGNIDFTKAIIIILLSADFFLPMRLLGSFFHIAMNGMASSDKIFRLLDIDEPGNGSIQLPEKFDIHISGLDFSYDGTRNALSGIDMCIPDSSFISIVGESGSGKSTIAKILMGRNKKFSGEIRISANATQKEKIIEYDFNAGIGDIDETSMMQKFTYISHNSYLFKGTVRYNLLMANPQATDEMLWNVLERVKLAGFLRGEDGLDTMLNERASNLSGGQCQRLTLARALLHDGKVYIFDEATSNIDVESENDILNEIHELSKSKTVILISHRLLNVVNSDKIFVLKKGKLVEQGTHQELVEHKKEYAKLWTSQQELENYRSGHE